MIDTMTFTKVLGGFCGSLLLFLLGSWAAEVIYHTGPSGHGGSHGEGHKQAYIIEVETESSGAQEEEGPDIATLVAEADVEKGAKVFSKCKACHKLENGANGTGPHLFGVVDRPVGGIDGFGYSSALTDMGGNWDLAALNGFLTNPKKYAKGTKMGFAGLKKEKDRANLIAYLSTIK